MKRPQRDRHAALHGTFAWQVPARFNIAAVCCARWARKTPAAVAVRWEHEDGRTATYTYRELQAAANRLSNALRHAGCRPR
jgi:acetyl-CoA synthetase